MTLFSQISMVVIIMITGIIIFYANKGLERAQEEGEGYSDEWELFRQMQKKRRMDEEDKLSQSDRLKQSGRSDRTRKNRILLEEPIRISVRNEEDQVEKEVVIRTCPFTIGRDEKNDLVIDDIRIAAHHCIIDYIDGNYVLKDCGSANKVKMDGRTISESILSDQSRFTLGDYECIVSK